MIRNPVDHSLNSAELGRLCREASAGLARLRSAFMALSGASAQLAINDTNHAVGVARVSSMVLCVEPERFYSLAAEPKAGPECRAVPWAKRRRIANGIDPWTTLEAECAATSAQLERLADGFRPNHPAVADRWAALASVVRIAWTRADQSRPDPEKPTKAKASARRSKFATNPSPVATRFES